MSCSCDSMSKTAFKSKFCQMQKVVFHLKIDLEILEIAEKF